VDDTTAGDRRSGTRVQSGPHRIHPAVHGDHRAPEQRLFPRTGRTYTVVDGDTLWDIARRVLDTNDIRRIARYWPRIHRANRSVIGRDPNLIFVGQKLVLPRESAPRR
jgi:nucleoid-associated protein YgaU